MGASIKENQIVKLSQTKEGTFAIINFDPKTSANITLYNIQERQVPKSISGNYLANQIELNIHNGIRCTYLATVDTPSETFQNKYVH